MHTCGCVHVRVHVCVHVCTCTCTCADLTLSSPEATLKANSTKQPTAMRTALDECISFHTVSLSTCPQSDKGH